jgi:hypothetical protein
VLITSEDERGSNEWLQIVTATEGRQRRERLKRGTGKTDEPRHYFLYHLLLSYHFYTMQVYFLINKDILHGLNRAVIRFLLDMVAFTTFKSQHKD